MSKGNYYSGSPLGSRLSDDDFMDRFMSVAAPWIVIGVFGLGAYGFYKLCTYEEFNQKNKEEQKTEQGSEQTRTPQDIIEYKNTKTL